MINISPFFSFAFSCFPTYCWCAGAGQGVASCLAGFFKKMNELLNQAQRGAQSSTLKTRSSVLAVLRLKIKNKKIVVFYLKLCKACSAGPVDSVAVVVTESTGDLFWGEDGEFEQKPCAWSEYSNFSV